MEDFLSRDLTEEKVIVGVEEDVDCDSWAGPSVARTTGKTTSPWYNPNTTVKVNTLKKVRKTWPVDMEQRARARKVVRPPLRTAGPMESRALMVFSSLSPAGNLFIYLLRVDLTFRDKIGMSNMDRVVHTETHR